MTNTREEQVAELFAAAKDARDFLWAKDNAPEYRDRANRLTKALNAITFAVKPSPDVWEATVRDLLDAAERGHEWAIDAANECRPEKDDAIFENAMRDIRRIEAAMTKARAKLPDPPKVTVEPQDAGDVR